MRTMIYPVFTLSFACFAFAVTERLRNDTKLDPQYSVNVELKEARNLADTDLIGKIDPFVELKFGVELKKSKTHKNAGTDLSFENEMINFHYTPPEDSKLHIRVMDENKLHKADLVGEAKIDIRGLESQQWEGSIQLYRSGGRAGLLFVKISTDIPIVEKERRPPFQLILAKIRNNTIAARITSTKDNENKPKFCTYEVQLKEIPETFGDSWNKNYDKEHAKLFANNPKGKALRAAIKIEHSLLYRDRFRNKEVETKWISGKEGFFDLFEYGIRAGIRRVFTYSIIDEGLYASETGMEMSKDFMSKHIVHANAALATRMSGTFRFCFDEENKEDILVMDNDSGTYRPTADHFPLMTILFSINFPGMRVEFLNVIDPQPEKTKAWTGPREVDPDSGTSPSGTSQPEAMDDISKYGPQVYAGKWVWKYKQLD